MAQSAPTRETHAAYRKLAIKWHPVRLPPRIDCLLLPVGQARAKCARYLNGVYPPALVDKSQRKLSADRDFTPKQWVCLVGQERRQQASRRSQVQGDIGGV